MRETSCLSKAGWQIAVHAKDPISSGLAIDGFLGRHFARTGAEVFSIGAGGSTIALTWHLMRKARGSGPANSDCRFGPLAARLEEIRRIHAALQSGVPTEYVLTRQV